QVEALRPAWASWTATFAPRSWQNPVMRCQAAVWASFHSPVSWGLIRPSGETAVASVTTSPKPPAARAQVHQMPVRGDAVLPLDHVLAHRGQPDAVAELELSQTCRGQECGDVDGIVGHGPLR